MKIFLLTILVSLNLVCLSQTKDTAGFSIPKDSVQHSKFYAWVNFNEGASFEINSIHNISSGIGINLMVKNKHLIQLNFLGLFNPTANSFMNYEEKLESLSSYILSYGLSKDINYMTSINFSVGPSLGRGVYLGGDTLFIEKRHPLLAFFNPWSTATVPYKYIGFYVSGQYLMRGRFLGLGIKTYINFHKYMDGGVALSFNLGYLKRKRN
jgi:hypothetical protein